MKEGKSMEDTHKTSEALRRAVRKYETEKVDRINCRLPKGLKERIQATGASVNSFIIDAVNEKLEKIERQQGVISAENTESDTK